MGQVRLGVDVGGTFTDLVAAVDGRLILAKVPSTPRDQAQGVLAAVERSGIDPGEVTGFSHGTTVATNALLERSGGARTALVTTDGFRDVLEIGRQARPALYDLTRDREPALVPRDLRFTVVERCGPGGELVPLDDQSVRHVAEALRESEVEAVAVCLLFSFLHPDHEERTAALLRDSLPGIAVITSAEVLPEFREYERFSTTVADAYLTPRLSGYLEALASACREHGLVEPMVMQSSGGVVDLSTAAGHAAACLLSGPAAGVVGAAYVAGLSGYEDLLTFDMGGTSTDVAPVRAGAVETTTEGVIAGIPVKLPAVDVHTVSAGGGSVAWCDGGGALRVGPRSAGADPGPACYGRGGEEPTVTDANLHLGLLPDCAALGGDVTLSAQAAAEALSRLAAELELAIDDVAAGVVAVANAEMVRALRVISVERGLDPREFTLVAFGGAGGLHACALAAELGVTRVLVPFACGVLSALGLAVGDVRRDYVRPLLGELKKLPEGSLEGAYRSLEERARRDLPDASLTRLIDCRYTGQSFELTVDGSDDAGTAFEAAHQQRYGYRMAGEPVEVVACRLVATVAGERPDLTAPKSHRRAKRSRRRAYIGAKWIKVEVIPRAALGAGARLRGPAVVEFEQATCLVAPGWRGSIDKVGSLVLERHGD